MILREDVNSFIEENKSFFENLFSEALNEIDEEKKLEKLTCAAYFASGNVCGFMSNSKIENELIKISQKYSVKLSEDFKPNSFLHVMTEPYLTGGHTRVVERWIKNSPDSQIHSLFVTKEKEIEKLPEELIKNVSNKKGEVIVLNDKDTRVQKALKLREIASQYEYVILHIHMFDVVPIIAFANEEFKRPVIFFNHADHVFWLGVSVSDLVVNLRGYSSTYNVKNRQCLNNEVLPLPIPKANKNYNVLENIEDINGVKEELGFKKDSKVIVTMANGYKYLPFFEYDFIETVKKILQRNEYAVLLAIGPNPKTKIWEDAFNDTNGRIKAIGEIDNKLVQKYLKIADLGLDSFPISSFVSMLEIARYNVPCLSLLTPLNDYDTFRDSKICCSSQEELIESACKYLNDKNSYENKLISILDEKHFEEGFARQLINLYEKFPKTHTVHPFETEENRELTDLEIFVAGSNLAIDKSKTQKFHIFKIPNVLEIYKQRNKLENVTYLSIFNKKFRLRARKIYC